MVGVMIGGEVGVRFVVSRHHMGGVNRIGSIKPMFGPPHDDNDNEDTKPQQKGPPLDLSEKFAPS